MKTTGSSLILSQKLFILLIVLFLPILGLNAQYYWVGGSGDWSDFANHWATSSGGSTFHTSPPSANDDVIFDANSFTQSGQLVSIDVSEAECNSMDWTGVTNNPGLVGGGISNTLNIYGSLTLSPDANYDFGAVEFESDDPGNTITTSGRSMGPTCIVRFMGSGTWDFQDMFTTYHIQIYAGTLNTNDNAIFADSYRTYGNDPKVLNMGSSVITVGTFRAGGSNLSLNAGTSSIVVSSSFYPDDSGNGPYSYYHVEIPEGGVIWDNAIISRLTLGNGGNANNFVKLASGVTIEIEELVIDASRETVLDLRSLTDGSEAFFSKSSGSIDVSYLLLKDIHATGGAAFNATESFDNGNTDGWNISPITSLDYFWVGDAGNWSDYENHWATSSGGSTFHSGPPTRFDAVYFDENSFTQANQTVTVDEVSYCGSIDFTGATNEPRIYAGYQDDLTLYGPATFIDEMTGQFFGLKLDGDLSGNELYFGGVSVQNLSIFGSGEWTLMNDIRVGNFSIRDEATFNSNGNKLEIVFTFGIYGNNTVNLGSSEIVTRDFRAPTGDFTFDPGSSNFIVNRDFRGEGHSYYKLTLEETGTVFDNNLFEILEILPATDASFEEGTVQTIQQSLILGGTPDGPINMGSTTAGNQASLSLGTGTVDGTFLILQDINATGGATFNALESIDNGNNTGWNITEIVPLDYFWVGGTGNWSDYENHWATTSGGSEFHYRVPGALDNVYFDANSFDAAGQVVTIDTDEVNFHDMDWTGATGNPELSGNQKSMNIFGSLTLIEEMEFDVTDLYFNSSSSETITTGNGMKPGSTSYMYFDSPGEWSLQDSLYVREINLLQGTLNTDNQAVHVDFRWYFEGESRKEVNAGTSSIYARSMQWNGSGDSLTLNAANAHISFSGWFSPGSVSNTRVINLGNLSAVQGNFSDAARLSESYSVDTFRIEAGKQFSMHSGVVLTMNQLIAKGTADDPISIYCVQEGNTATFSQSAGTVNAEYLELKDNTATGGAVFNAASSVDLGNVSGWTFTKEAQTISFEPLADKLVTDDPFTVSATATSGLPVSFSILTGPASIEGNTITLSGQPGTVTVQATQSGDIDYFAAQTVSQSFEVNKLTQSIDFPQIEDKYTTDDPFTVSATASSGLTVSFSILSGPATIAGNTITLTGEEGSVEVEASQLGDDTYEAVSLVNSFEVTDDPAVSVVDRDAGSDIHIWPNPVSDRLYIDVYGLKDPTLSIIDISGKIISIERNLYQTPSGYYIDVTGLRNGIYFINVGSEHYRKFVVKE